MRRHGPQFAEHLLRCFFLIPPPASKKPLHKTGNEWYDFGNNKYLGPIPEARIFTLAVTWRSVDSNPCSRVSKSSVRLSPKTGKPFDDIKKAFLSACEDAGIEGLVWHDLRAAMARG